MSEVFTIQPEAVQRRTTLLTENPEAAAFNTLMSHEMPAEFVQATSGDILTQMPPDAAEFSQIVTGIESGDLGLHEKIEDPYEALSIHEAFEKTVEKAELDDLQDPELTRVDRDKIFTRGDGGLSPTRCQLR